MLVWAGVRRGGGRAGFAGLRADRAEAAEPCPGADALWGAAGPLWRATAGTCLKAPLGRAWTGAWARCHRPPWLYAAGFLSGTGSARSPFYKKVHLCYRKESSRQNYVLRTTPDPLTGLKQPLYSSCGDKALISCNTQPVNCSATNPVPYSTLCKSKPTDAPRSRLSLLPPSYIATMVLRGHRWPPSGFFTWGEAKAEDEERALPRLSRGEACSLNALGWKEGLSPTQGSLDRSRVWGSC